MAWNEPGNNGSQIKTHGAIAVVATKGRRIWMKCSVS